MKLKEALLGYSKEDLYELTKMLDIKKVSSLNKEKLADLIAERLLMPEEMRKRMSVLSDWQMTVFTSIIKGEYSSSDTNIDDILVLTDSNYISVTDEDEVIVPDDVKEVFFQINDKTFDELRKTNNWVMMCLYFGKAHYGYYPLSVLKDMINSKPGFTMEIKDILEVLNTIPKDINNCIIVKEYIISSFLNQESICKALIAKQKGKDYYIPSIQEIEEYWETSALISYDSYQKLKRYILNKSNLNSSEADEVLYDIWDMLANGEGFVDAIKMLIVDVLDIKDRSNLSQLTGLIKNAANDTRMLINRGHTPLEISELYAQINQNNRPVIVPESTLAAQLINGNEEKIRNIGFEVNLDYNAIKMPIISFPNGIQGDNSITYRKVYPNDPCPCRSGKIFKKCCGINK